MARDYKNKTTAAFLALFGGIFGVHKFYLKDPGGGVFFLFLFFMTSKFFPVSMLLGVFDAFRLFNMSQENFDSKYNKAALRRAGRNGGRKEPLSDREQRRTRANAAPKRRKVRSNPYKASGIKKIANFELEDAVLDLENALKIDDQDPDIHYAMASAYSLLEKKDKAYEHLSLAVSYGYKDLDKILKDDNLAYLRIQSDFDEMKSSGFTRAKTAKLEAPKQDLLQDDVLLSQLNKLAELRKRGLLSETEFAQERKKLLRR